MPVKPSLQTPSGSPDEPSLAAAAMPSAVWRTALSLLLAIHLAAVFMPPFTFITASPGTISPLAEKLMRLLRPYVDATYMNHGYAFFAPDPGPSHLVRYRLEFDDDRPPVEKQFPNLKHQWPRLLYHRHFMLAEQLNGDFVSPNPPQRPPRLEIDDPVYHRQQRREAGRWEQDNQAWQSARRIYQAKWQSYENHLRVRYGAARVMLQRIEHVLPQYENFFKDNIQLTDPNSYRVLTEGEQVLPPPEQLEEIP